MICANEPPHRSVRPDAGRQKSVSPEKKLRSGGARFSFLRFHQEACLAPRPLGRMFFFNKSRKRNFSSAGPRSERSVLREPRPTFPRVMRKIQRQRFPGVCPGV